MRRLEVELEAADEGEAVREEGEEVGEEGEAGGRVGVSFGEEHDGKREECSGGGRW